jgi:catechol 2,3-dioxygenase-like lactoylglutathione lyase family enzyme
VGQDSPIAGVDFVSVPTADYARAAEFYGTTLGLECSSTYGRIPGGEFETGSLTLQVVETAAIGVEFRPNALPIAFHVDDVAARRADLEARGLEFGGEILDTGVCHMAFFKDPDGNPLMLHRRYAPRA